MVLPWYWTNSTVQYVGLERPCTSLALPAGWGRTEKAMPMNGAALRYPIAIFATDCAGMGRDPSAIPVYRSGRA